MYFRTDRRRSETGCQTLRGDDPGSSGSKNDPLQCRVFVKQLNQKLNYFTVSVKRVGKKQRKTSDARLKDRASLIFYLNTFFDIVNLAAVPGEESMSNILSSGNENNADKTFSSAQTYRGAPTHIRYGRKTGKTRPSITATGSTGKAPVIRKKLLKQAGILLPACFVPSPCASSAADSKSVVTVHGQCQ